jgi:hypothetical protein
MSDIVNHPSHYTTGKVECIDAIEAATQGLEGLDAVCTANAIKYLWRWKKKNGIEDLHKAVWYTEKLIDKLSATEGTEKNQKLARIRYLYEKVRTINNEIEDLRKELNDTDDKEVQSSYAS